MLCLRADAGSFTPKGVLVIAFIEFYLNSKKKSNTILFFRGDANEQFTLQGRKLTVYATAKYRKLNSSGSM